ncbi:MAG: T9SS type A sorting domain-containing protein [Bacteroidetes bacterium]|nr:T9SS type A sorting domain-containing protein [Bacteroidota bacterium]
MNAHLRMAVFSFLLTCTCYLHAQPIQVLLPVLNQETTGNLITVPVKVINFDSVLSAQFVIRWNPSVLTFFSLSSYNLPELNAQDFNIENALDSGLIRFAWESPNNTIGTSKPDSSIIFKIKFTVTGPLLSGSPIQITESFPTLFEITKTNQFGGLIPINISQAGITQGFVAVGYTVSGEEPLPVPLNLKITPNPVQDLVRIQYELPEAGPVQIRILNFLGQVCYTQLFDHLESGLQILDIPANSSINHGMYFLHIESSRSAGNIPFLKL